MRRRRLVAAAAVLAAATGISSCSLTGDGEGGSDGAGGPDASPSLAGEPLATAGGSGAGSAAKAPVPGLQRFYDQQLGWSDCRDEMRCAELEVPLNYDDPRGETITLAVLEVPAAEPERRVGALVVNPGGPGGSGVDYAAQASAFFGRELRSAYDIVGFDPRGVAGSTPVDCVTDDELDALVGADPDPDTAAERAEGDRLLRRLGRGCLQRSGDLVRHVSTVEAARDIDVLRAVLGQDTLAYFGASYGTFLGATYADLFPERVGRMVLDGAVDPDVGLVKMSLVQARGFEVALRAYVAHCVEDGDCFLGDSVDAGVATVQDLLRRTDAQPLPGDGERELTEGRAVLGIWAPLYNQDYWSVLDVGLEQALDGDGKTLLQFADAYVSREPDGYADNMTEANYAINCLDHDESVPSAQVARYEPRFLEASPTFGRVFAAGLSACGNWPVHSGRKPHPLHAKGAAPILVVGTTRDPATPLRWAKALASQLASGVLVTRDGDGHTGYLAGNACVDDTVEEYLVAGTVPDSDVSC